MQSVQHVLIQFTQVFANRLERYILFAVPRKRQFRAITAIDPAELAEFQSGLRRRYSDEEILEELRACSARLERSPTMKEFADDPATRVHPQTVIEHFGSWNKAKRLAGLVPRRNATRAELIGQLEELGKRLGRVPRFNDWADARRGDPSLLTEWQVYRMFDARRGAWSTFQFLLLQRLREEGVEVGRDGSLGAG